MACQRLWMCDAVTPSSMFHGTWYQQPAIYGQGTINSPSACAHTITASLGCILQILAYVVMFI